MPVRHFANDLSERPIVSMGVSISTIERMAQPQDAVFVPWPVRVLVDTGAGRSQVDIHILSSFGLAQTGDVKIYTASTGDTPEEMPLYLIDLLFVDDQPGLVAQNLEVVGSDKLSGLNVDMLLGRDVLDRCLLVYDGANRRFSLGYNPPRTLF